MAIQIMAIQCPACGADLDVESGREQTFCSYCGTKILLKNDNEQIIRKIDEARVTEAETDRMIRLKELELQQEEEARARKGTMIAYIVAGIVIAIGALAFCIDPENISTMTVGFLFLIGGVGIAFASFLKNDEAKKKRTTARTLKSGEARITDAMSEYQGQNFAVILAYFKSAGFTNVTTVPVHDVNLFTMGSIGQVISVSVNGDEEFEAGDIVSKNSAVVISYHMK